MTQDLASRTHADAAEAKASGRARGRPVGDREAKRAELLAAAIAVIAQEGYAGASLRRVAEQAGCTTGALTYAFANKEAMVQAVIESLFDEFDTWIHPDREPEEIRAIMERWLNWASTEPNGRLVLIQLLVHARREPALAAVVQRRNGRIIAAIATVLAKGQAQGLVRRDIPADILADQLSAMGDGWMMSLPVETGRFEPGRLQALLDAVVTLVRPPASASA
jgi:AcrR family transcriptional regulator